jgi:hypothetical protein
MSRDRASTLHKLPGGIASANPNINGFISRGTKHSPVPPVKIAKFFREIPINVRGQSSEESKDSALTNYPGAFLSKNCSKNESKNESKNCSKIKEAIRLGRFASRLSPN